MLYNLCSVLTYQSRYLDFPLAEFSAKLDQVILPAYGAGAMESFGLIFYKKDYINLQSTIRKRIKAITTLAHEIRNRF